MRTGSTTHHYKCGRWIYTWLAISKEMEELILDLYDSKLYDFYCLLSELTVKFNIKANHVGECDIVEIRVNSSVQFVGHIMVRIYSFNFKLNI
jgi:hypothetical protein